MGLANYAQTADIAAVLADVAGPQQATWPQLLSIASRGIDGFCRRYFYADGPATKYFDVDGDPCSRLPVRLFRSDRHDFHTVTAVKVATRENADPGVGGDWVTLAGDGITPPADFYLEPANQQYVGQTGDTHLRPFYRIELPSTGPSTSTTFQRGLRIGKRTLSIAATWGWPAIPDEIKDVTVKIVVRMYKAAPSGFTGQTGAPEIGTVSIQSFLDRNDLFTLGRFRKRKPLIA